MMKYYLSRALICLILSTIWAVHKSDPLVVITYGLAFYILWATIEGFSRTIIKKH